MSNPFSFLPKPGQCAQIPGGFIQCAEWKVREQHQGLIEGKITFRFECRRDEYDRAMAEPQALPPPPLALPEP